VRPERSNPTAQQSAAPHLLRARQSGHLRRQRSPSISSRPLQERPAAAAAARPVAARLTAVSIAICPMHLRAGAGHHATAHQTVEPSLQNALLRREAWRPGPARPGLVARWLLSLSHSHSGPGFVAWPIAVRRGRGGSPRRNPPALPAPNTRLWRETWPGPGVIGDFVVAVARRLQPLGGEVAIQVSAEVRNREVGNAANAFGGQRTRCGSTIRS